MDIPNGTDEGRGIQHNHYGDGMGDAHAGRKPDCHGHDHERGGTHRGYHMAVCRMSEAIHWTNETRRLDELQPWPRNPRQIRGEQRSNEPNVNCAYCGKAFHVKPCAIRRGRGKFCSKECQRNAGSVIRKCEVCGTEFRFKVSHAVKGEGRYCSMKCRTIGYDQRGILKGINAPRYIDGMSQSPEYVCRAAHKRRALKRANGGEYTIQEWLELCDKYGNKCLSCGRNDVPLTVDHVVPIILGGTNDISNLQPLCRSCNSKKNKHVIDYRQAIV